MLPSTRVFAEIRVSNRPCARLLFCFFLLNMSVSCELPPRKGTLSLGGLATFCLGNYLDFIRFKVIRYSQGSLNILKIPEPKTYPQLFNIAGEVPQGNNFLLTIPFPYDIHRHETGNVVFVVAHLSQHELEAKFIVVSGLIQAQLINLEPLTDFRWCHDIAVKREVGLQ